MQRCRVLVLPRWTAQPLLEAHDTIAHLRPEALQQHLEGWTDHTVRAEGEGLPAVVIRNPNAVLFHGWRPQELEPLLFDLSTATEHSAEEWGTSVLCCQV